MKAKVKKRTHPSRKQATLKPKTEQCCLECERELRPGARALFVEEEVGRVFCSEGCIVEFFSTEIEKLDRQFHSRLLPEDLTPEQREKLANLRWKTLQRPDEIWCTKTVAGDHRYTLIAMHEFFGEPVWNICISLFLRGEPSFLFLAFTTRMHTMVECYREGERLEWKTRSAAEAKHEDGHEIIAKTTTSATDGLAAPFTDEELMRAQLNQQRRDDDIPSEEFSRYQHHLEETLQGPDEVWSFESGGRIKPAEKMFHFVRHYPDEERVGIWYIIVAREAEQGEMIEILDAFPTRDFALVNRYRCGKQEVGVGSGAGATSKISRVVH